MLNAVVTARFKRHEGVFDKKYGPGLFGTEVERKRNRMQRTMSSIVSTLNRQIGDETRSFASSRDFRQLKLSKKGTSSLASSLNRTGKSNKSGYDGSEGAAEPAALVFAKDYAVFRGREATGGNDVTKLVLIVNETEMSKKFLH